jgi:hypothetical protein
LPESREKIPTQATTPITTLQPPLILEKMNPSKKLFEILSERQEDFDTTTSYDTTEFYDLTTTSFEIENEEGSTLEPTTLPLN